MTSPAAAACGRERGSAACWSPARPSPPSSSWSPVPAAAVVRGHSYVVRDHVQPVRDSCSERTQPVRDSCSERTQPERDSCSERTQPVREVR